MVDSFVTNAITTEQKIWRIAEIAEFVYGDWIIIADSLENALQDIKNLHFMHF
jgi:hypothetical protein